MCMCVSAVFVFVWILGEKDDKWGEERGRLT